MKLDDFVAGPIIAIFGIATVISVVFSPILFVLSIYNFKLTNSSWIKMLFLCLATLHLIIVAIVIYEIYPLLMSV